MNAKSVAPWQAQSNPRLSLIFEPGQRPAAADVVRLAQSPRRQPGFAVSHQPPALTGWLELLADGQTFDLSGLAPTPPAQVPPPAHFYGFTQKPFASTGEAVTVMPGEQLWSRESLLPVIRIMAGLAAHLVGLAHATAVVWHPSRSVMAPPVFAAAVTRWLGGGAFPALGLTALFRDADGAICSEGLAFFIGQELRIEPSIGQTPAQDAKIAARLINLLVGIGTIHQSSDFMGPNGEHLSVEPLGDGGLLRVWRKT